MPVNIFQIDSLCSLYLEGQVHSSIYMAPILPGSEPAVQVEKYHTSYCPNNS